MSDISEFEQWVNAIHNTLADDTIEFGLFNVAAESIGALRRVIWIPTTFKCDNNRNATFGTTSNGTMATDELFVECHITGADFTDTCALRTAVMNATRKTLGTYSRPVDGKYFAEVQEDDTLLWGGAAKVVQRFAWHMDVPEVNVFTARVRQIDIVDSTQITTTTDGVLTPSEQMVITEDEDA